jgi:hypothetical protein
MGSGEPQKGQLRLWPERWIALSRDLLKQGEGRFFRGNLHCHSNRSDGLWEPEEVVGAYRDAGYDFVCLSDHFEAEYGWRITDTRPFRGENFTTILGAELSSAPWDERDCYWVTAAGLPLDFEAPPVDDHAEAIRRAGDVGAFVVMLHPGLNNLPLAATDRLPALEAVHAVEVYNHNLATAAPDGANGGYMLDGLLEGPSRAGERGGRRALRPPARPLRGLGGGPLRAPRPRRPAGVAQGRPLLLYPGTPHSRAGRRLRPAARGDERRLRDLADRERRSVAERVGAHERGRRADHGGRIRPGPLPRFLLPRHRGRSGRQASLEQPGLALTQTEMSSAASSL